MIPLLKTSTILLLKKVLECKERSRIWLERGGVIPMPEKIQNAVPASVLLRKNFRNDILACSVTKISLLKTVFICTPFYILFHYPII
jgi:hypothetical protein